MEKQTIGSCANCAFFVPFTNPGKVTLSVGECKRFPPQPSGMGVSETHESDFCGEWTDATKVKRVG